MATSTAPGSVAAVDNDKITRYQWIVLLSAFLGWMFDSMDLNLFTLVLFPSVSELIGSTNPAEVSKIGSLIIAIKLLTWGLGGVLFGVLTDRWGRARVMGITIFIYAGFTLLSAFAQNWEQLAICQALAGLGIGGEWAAGAALVAETWPEKHRARAMQIMQMAFAFGFFVAALDNLLLGPLGWRWVLAFGVVPALVTIFVRMFVKEPERWVHVRGQVDAMTASQTFATIFRPGLRRNTIVGVIVASSVMLGCWGGLTLLPSWINQLVRAEGGTNSVQSVSYAFMLMMVGAVFGYLSLIWMLEALGRRVSYFIFALFSFLSSMYLFLYIHDLKDVLWFMLVYGFFVIGGFGTFAAYLPELFPTRVRATGQGFCWNLARAVTALGPLAGSALVTEFGSFPKACAAVAMLYIVGLVVIWFGPETKGVALRD